MPNFREHHNCKNCGWCCCIVPITAAEELKIRQHIKSLDSFLLQNLRNQPRGHDECQFHDPNHNRCAIYAVRPKICRMFGTVLGMNCPHGNSSNLNLKHLLNKQPLMLMPELIDRKVSNHNSAPLARLSTAKDAFRHTSCLLAVAEVEYKYRNHNNLFQCSIEFNNKKHPLTTDK